MTESLRFLPARVPVMPSRCHAGHPARVDHGLVAAHQAQNITYVTNNGVVVLRGPVASQVGTDRPEAVCGFESGRHPTRTSVMTDRHIFC